MTGFTFGADPEIFLGKGDSPVSAYGVIEGDKENPCPVTNGAIQVDGMAVEFNIDPVPSNDFGAFNSSIVSVMKQLKDRVKQHDDKIVFKLQPTMEFGQEFLDGQPEEAKMLGCDPDFNAYTGKMNDTPDGTRTFRTAAGHVHVGWGADIPVDNPEHLEICANFIKHLDATVGLFMTIIDRDPKRRELYGKAGAFRPKPYGVEYRTPSNMWLANKDYRRCVHILMNVAIARAKNGQDPDHYTKSLSGHTAEQIINSGNYGAALYPMAYLSNSCRQADSQFVYNLCSKLVAEYNNG